MVCGCFRDALFVCLKFRKGARTVNFMTVRQAANELGVSAFALRRMLKDDDLPGYYSGNRYYVNIPQTKKKLGILEDGSAAGKDGAEE